MAHLLRTLVTSPRRTKLGAALVVTSTFAAVAPLVENVPEHVVATRLEGGTLRIAPAGEAG